MGYLPAFAGEPQHRLLLVVLRTLILLLGSQAGAPTIRALWKGGPHHLRTTVFPISDWGVPP